MKKWTSNFSGGVDGIEDVNNNDALENYSTIARLSRDALSECNCRRWKTMPFRLLEPQLCM
jgi:hypothetical protein